MFLYEIKNVVNDKRYVGQTTKINYNNRWIEHKTALRRNIHKNKHLQSAWNKYGEESFIFNVLESAKSQKELDFLEIQYIKKYKNCKYNLTDGGRGGKKSLETRTKMKFARTKVKCGDKISNSKRRGKLYPTLISPNGEEYNFTNLRFFALEHRLDPRCLSHVVLGHYQHHKGWFVKDRPVDYTRKSKRICKAKRPQGYPSIISPNGTIYKQIENLRQFVKEHQLNYSGMQQLFRNPSWAHRGWKIYTENYNG